MRSWIERRVCAAAALAMVAAVGLAAGSTAAAPGANGQGKGPAVRDGAGAGIGAAASGAAASGAGVPTVGEAVVLRPSGPVPGQYIVTFQDDVTNARGLANALARQNGLALRGVYRTALKGFAARMPEAVAERLALDPSVASVEHDVHVHAVVQSMPTGVDRIDAELSVAFEGSPVDADVAVIDTGLHPHSDYNWSNARFYNCIGGCTATDAFDDNGHGTHVAGTIGAFDNDDGVVGVAPGARLWGFKVLDSSGNGFISDIIAAVDQVTALGVIEVANMSLSGQGFVAAFRTAIQNSVASGVVHVVAAGNAQMDVYGPDGVLNESASFGCLLLGRNCPDDIIPASYPEAMAVSALADFDGVEGGLVSDAESTITFSSCTHTGDDVFACFTNFSQSVDASNPVASPGAAIDVAAPGVRILSTWNDGGYRAISGTSMASPHVAGAVALYVAENYTAFGMQPNSASEVAEIRQALIDTAQAQSQWGPTDTEDPDGNAEGLVYVGLEDGGDGDAVPSVTVTAPTDGAIVSGTADVTADASDDNGVVRVEFLVDGGSIGVDSDGTDGWSAGWDTASYADGAYTVTAIATDDADQTASDSVGVTVDNVDDSPTVVLTDPSDGATVSGTVDVTADASDDNGVDRVEFFVAGGSIGVDSDGTDGWSLSWDTASYADGDYTITAAATDTGSQTATSAGVGVTVDNSGDGGAAVSVGSFAYTTEGGRNQNKHLNVTVALVDDADSPVGGASVSVRVDADTGQSTTGTGTTDGNGEAVFSWKNSPGTCYTTTVTDVIADGLSWDPDDPSNTSVQFCK